MLASGQVAPHIGASFPLDEVGAALGLVARGEAVGKVIIDVDVDVDGDGRVPR